MAAARSLPKAGLSPVELELQKLWQDAITDFQRMTGEDISANSGKNPDNVVRALEEKYEARSEDAKSTKSKMKHTVKQVLECVQLLGGLAASGASVVFGPATCCMNAVSVLIEAPKKIAAVYEGIGLLLEEVSHVLALFRIYRNYTKLDPELSKGTHNLMLTLIKICGMSTRIIDSKHSRHLTVMLKATFLKDDSGVADELTKFKGLIEKHNHVTEAITLQHVLTTKDSTFEILKRQQSTSEDLKDVRNVVNTLAEDANDRKKERVTSKQVETITKLLSVTGESTQGVRLAMKKLKERLLEGSSKWLLEDPDYIRWRTMESASKALLVLSGAPKTGRSSLLASVDRDFRKYKHGVAIAYHSFAGRDVKGPRDNDVNDVTLALKSMALQLAGQNKIYANKIAELKDSDFRTPESEKELDEKQLWDRLHFSTDLQSKEDVSIVLMFDGVDVDELSERGVQRFLKLLVEKSKSCAKLDHPRLRILATGETTMLQHVQDEHDFIRFNIVDHNIEDIKLYIEQELCDDEILQGQHAEMLELQETVRKILPEVAKGSFLVAQQKLARIREAVDSDAYIDEAIMILNQNPAEDQGKIAQTILSDLNATLNAHDIKQLNELLNWAIFGYQWFSIDDLQAVLFLSSGRSPLQPLEKKFKNKYARIFQYDKDRVEVVDSVEDLFRSADYVAPGKAAALDNTDAKITMDLSIRQADVRTVQQFCWDLTERVGIGRFDFVMANSHNESKGVIHCDRPNAKYRMAELLLKLLNDEPHEKTKALVKYALMYLHSHLQDVKEALDEGKLGTLARKTIAKRLVDLLSDFEGIGKFWNTLRSMQDHWAGDLEVKTIRAWLTDEKTLDELEPKERRWVRQHTMETEGIAGFYKPITLMVGKEWLLNRNWDARDAYEWINSFISMQRSHDSDSDSEDETAITIQTGELPEPSGDRSDVPFISPDSPNISTSPRHSSITSSRTQESADESIAEIPQYKKICSAAKWVQKALEVKGEDSLWYERIGETCYKAGEFETAIHNFNKAEQLPPYHWKVNEGRALANAKLDKLEDACHNMSLVLDVLRQKVIMANGSDLSADDDCEMLVQCLNTFASWKKRLEETNQVVELVKLYEEVLRLNPLEHRTRCDLLQLLCEQKREEEAKNMLVQIQTQRSKLKDLNQLSELLRHLADDEDKVEGLNLIVNLAQTDKTFGQNALQAFQDAIDYTRKNSIIVNQAILLLHQGIIQARNTRDDTHLEKAVHCWEDCQSLQSPIRSLLRDTRELAGRYIAQHHFQLATGNGAEDQAVGQRALHFNELLRMSRMEPAWTYRFRPTSYLASCFVHRDKPEEARELFMQEMTDALDLLSDTDPDNDSYGYMLLGTALTHTGDDLHALSAWSLLGPYADISTSVHGMTLEESKTVANNAREAQSPDPIPDRDPAPEPEYPDSESHVSSEPGRSDIEIIRYACDGDCGKRWSYPDDVYVCRYCPDTGFDAECMEKLKSGKLLKYICHPDHSWLHVPVWSDEEARKVGKGNVRAHGKLVDGKRVGGDIVSISEWLDEICEIWGLPKVRGETVESPSGE